MFCSATEKRYEILDGELVFSPSTTAIHQIVLLKLAKMTGEFVEQNNEPDDLKDSVLKMEYFMPLNKFPVNLTLASRSNFLASLAILQKEAGLVTLAAETMSFKDT